MLYQFFESVVTLIKDTITNLFSTTPYKGKIEKHVYLGLEHTLFFIGGFLTFWKKDWLYDLTMIWDYQFDPAIYIYYFLYSVRYIIQLDHLDKREKDYNIFLVHHLMTLTLLAVSCYRYTRIGVIIALSHDIVDIFLNFAKVMNKVYDISHQKIHLILSNLSLVCFLISWIPTRIILNFNILYEIHNHKNMGIKVFIYDCWLDEQICIVLLYLNFSLQIFWQVLIIKFAYNIFINAPGEDEKGEKYKTNS